MELKRIESHLKVLQRKKIISSWEYVPINKKNCNPLITTKEFPYPGGFHFTVIKDNREGTTASFWSSWIKKMGDIDDYLLLGLYK